MNEKIKKSLISLLIIAALIAGGYYLLFVDKQADKKEGAKKEGASKSDLTIKELADKYQSIIGWEENLAYTLQAQERLITEKPILFSGYVDDVFNRDGKTFVRFSSSFLSPINYVLELECNREILDKIFSKQESGEDGFGFFNEYAMIANIQKVSKPVFALKGSVLSGEDVEINIESSGLFTAKGICIDVAYIGDNW